MQETQQPTIWALGLTFGIVAIAAVVLRFAARRIKGQKWAVDDWTILVALILSLGQTADILIMTQVGGLGTHTRLNNDGMPADPDGFVAFGKSLFVTVFLNWPAVGMTKISVLLMYKRIFDTPRFKMLCWFMIAFCIEWTFAFTTALLFSCIPIQSNWDYTLEYTCVDLAALFTVALTTDVITDFVILLLPVYKVWKLQMPLSRKITIIGIFMLGILVSIVGLIRMQYLAKADAVLDGFVGDDVTWHYSEIYYWTIIECNVGVLSACLPTLRPIQERLFSFSALRGSLDCLLSSWRLRTAGSGNDVSVDLEHVEKGLRSGFVATSAQEMLRPGEFPVNRMRCSFDRPSSQEPILAIESAV